MASLIVLAHVHTLVGRRAEVLEVFREAAAAARAEDGCLHYEFAESVEDPGRFVLVEEWRDQAALDAHFRSPGFQAYQENVGDLLARPSEMWIHRVSETVMPVDSAPMDPRRAD
jgi:quinol monooxygenase YgiN